MVTYQFLNKFVQVKFFELLSENCHLLVLPPPLGFSNIMLKLSMNLFIVIYIFVIKYACGPSDRPEFCLASQTDYLNIDLVG